MGGFRAYAVIDPAIVNIADNVSRSLKFKVLPAALDAAAAIVQPVLVAEIARLADGTESRKLQTEKSKRKFPTKLSAETAIKRFRPRKNTVLRIVGVKESAAHAKFDHGDKALRGEGRVHILWGKAKAKVSPRRQRHDIAALVKVKVMPAVEALVKKHLESAVATGEILKP